MLGLTHLFTTGTMAFFDCGGVRLLLSQQQQPAAESMIYFKVDNILAVHQRLVQAGGQFRNPPRLPHRYGNGMEECMAFLDDPDQRPVALILQVTPARS